MKKNMINTIMVATSILMLSACGGDDNEKKDDVVVIDTSTVQEIEEVNETKFICRLGDELIIDHNASVLSTEVDRSSLEWKMTLDSGKDKDLRVDECILSGGEKRLCFQVNPQAPGTGMYQDISTETGKRYRVSAELIGADNVNDKNNFDLGSSYVSIEENKPQEISKPIALSDKIKGNTPIVVEFDFNATKENMYIQLRGDTAFAYPSAFYISTRELITQEISSAEVNSSDTVPCNLPK